MADDQTEPERPEPRGGERAPSGPDGTGPEMDRLPPPAFPPGSRRSSVPTSRVSEEDGAGPAEEAGEALGDDAFISPDEPIRKQARGIPDDAFISPDDPFVPADREGGEAGERAQVTGVGDESARVAAATARRTGAPSIHELPYLLDRVAEQIHESGEQALRVHHEMGHFEAALKSFLVGYLKGTSE